jgi:hypothetical protein
MSDLLRAVAGRLLNAVRHNDSNGVEFHLQRLTPEELSSLAADSAVLNQMALAELARRVPVPEPTNVMGYLYGND